PGQVLVRAREDLLEDVLRVVLGQPEGLDGDRIDVAGEALDQAVPGVAVAASAAGDELRVGQRVRHRSSSSRIRIFAISRNPSRRRIGSDIEPACVTSAGVPRATASSHRARTSARYAPRPRAWGRTLP